jgi:hypothetical protein
MRLALDKGQQYGASQLVMSRLENDILGTTAGRQALDTMITRSTDALLIKEKQEAPDLGCRLHFEEREFDRKLANGHAEQLFWKSVA